MESTEKSTGKTLPGKPLDVNSAAGVIVVMVGIGCLVGSVVTGMMGMIYALVDPKVWLPFVSIGLGFTAWAIWRVIR